MDSVKQGINSKIIRITKLRTTLSSLQVNGHPTSLELLCDYLLDSIRSSDQILVTGVF